MSDQVLLLTVIFAAMVMFLSGSWRHDVVAMGALLVCVVTGLVPGEEAFSGFGHPAVITVACVLVLGHGLRISGAVDILTRRFIPSSAGPSISILALIAMAALLSAFMNNVGALALLMPVAIQMASKQDMPPGKILMPLAFGSILGGMTTLIGTPPNLIVSGFRASTGAQSFTMFDFTPVGFLVAFCGIVFIALLGWRLVPARRQPDSGGFVSGKYLSEVRIIAGSKAIDKRLSDVEQMLDEADAQIISMIRQGVSISAPNSRRILKEDDILVVQVEPESLSSALSSLGLKLEEHARIDAINENSEAPANAVPDTGNADEHDKPDEVVLQELVVMPNSLLIGRSAMAIGLRTRYGISLLAISREGHRSIQRLRSTPIRASDVLLLQGTPESISVFASIFGCLPLAPRDIRVPEKGHALIAALIMVATVAAAALGLLPVATLFAGATFSYIVLGIVPLRSVYTAIDWPVIVLLAAMLPVAGAISTTGTADTVARFLLDEVTQGDAVIGLVALMLLTMFLSDLVNNAATAAIMCPVALSTAAQLGVNADAFLMAIAVGASCAFLTPIGHQNNTLILGPGGFRFGDFWRMGLLLEIIVVLVSTPAILWVWPL